MEDESGKNRTAQKIIDLFPFANKIHSFAADF
jgi:hypothetical protein